MFEIGSNELRVLEGSIFKYAFPQTTILKDASDKRRPPKNRLPKRTIHKPRVDKASTWKTDEIMVLVAELATFKDSRDEGHFTQSGFPPLAVPEDTHTERVQFAAGLMKLTVDEMASIQKRAMSHQAIKAAVRMEPMLTDAMVERQCLPTIPR